MKLKKAILLYGTVCILGTIIAGCGSSSETAAKMEETQAEEALPEELNDAPLKDVDGSIEEPQENAAGKWQVLEPDVAAAVDADIPGSQLIHVVLEEATRFYLKDTDENEESNGNKEAGFQDLKEHMSVEIPPLPWVIRQRSVTGD